MVVEAGRMVNVRVEVPVPTVLAADKFTIERPAMVGVPEMTPVCLTSNKPVGKFVAPYPVGVFVAED